MTSKHLVTITMGIVLSLVAMGCSMIFRPTVEEVRAELVRLIDPALEAGLGGAQRPEGFAGTSYCHEPLIGPADGVRPGLSYMFSFSILEGTPDDFLKRVEDHWRSEGLRIEVQETENAHILFSGKDGYSISAAILYDSMEVDMGGTGPCVDNPDPD